MDKYILALGAFTMLWIGLMGTIASAFVNRVLSIDFSLAIFSPLLVSFLGMVMFILFVSGGYEKAIDKLRGVLGSTRQEGDLSSEEPSSDVLAQLIEEIDRKLKEGGALIAGYEKSLPKLAQKEAKPS